MINLPLMNDNITRDDVNVLIDFYRITIFLRRIRMYVSLRKNGVNGLESNIVYS